MVKMGAQVAEWISGSLFGVMLEVGTHLFRCVLFSYCNGRKRERFILSRLEGREMVQKEIRLEAKESISPLWVLCLPAEAWGVSSFQGWLEHWNGLYPWHSRWHSFTTPCSLKHNLPSHDCEYRYTIRHFDLSEEHWGAENLSVIRKDVLRPFWWLWLSTSIVGVELFSRSDLTSWLWVCKSSRKFYIILTCWLQCDLNAF